mmetsp:Transcript_110960/g.318811  ORF Transcript_110960/g.318811 Transcript_110960/m.318811 type:complete len:290 (-) Transcript_110960:636-1505(-)
MQCRPRSAGGVGPAHARGHAVGGRRPTDHEGDRLPLRRAPARLHRGPLVGIAGPPGFHGGRPPSVRARVAGQGPPWRAVHRRCQLAPGRVDELVARRDGVRREPRRARGPVGEAPLPAADRGHVEPRGGSLAAAPPRPLGRILEHGCADRVHEPRRAELGGRRRHQLRRPPSRVVGRERAGDVADAEVAGRRPGDPRGRHDHEGPAAALRRGGLPRQVRGPPRRGVCGQDRPGERGAAVPRGRERRRREVGRAARDLAAHARRRPEERRRGSGRDSATAAAASTATGER